jgi:hypothetical protein
MTGPTITDATLSGVLERVAAWYEEARPMLWFGITGLALAAVCSVKGLSMGMAIPPEGI